MLVFFFLEKREVVFIQVLYVIFLYLLEIGVLFVFIFLFFFLWVGITIDGIGHERVGIGLGDLGTNLYSVCFLRIIYLSAGPWKNGCKLYSPGADCRDVEGMDNHEMSLELRASRCIEIHGFHQRTGLGTGSGSPRTLFGRLLRERQGVSVEATGLGILRRTRNLPLIGIYVIVYRRRSFHYI